MDSSDNPARLPARRLGHPDQTSHPAIMPPCVSRHGNVYGGELLPVYRSNCALSLTGLSL